MVFPGRLRHLSSIGNIFTDNEICTVRRRSDVISFPVYRGSHFNENGYKTMMKLKDYIQIFCLKQYFQEIALFVVPSRYDYDMIHLLFMSYLHCNLKSLFQEWICCM